MRRALIIAVSILLLVSISFGVYQYFYHKDIPIEYEDFESKQKYLYDDRYFEGKFKMKVEGQEIMSYDFYHKTDDIYITLYTNIDQGTPLKKDKDGYVTVKIDAGKEIDKVCYKCNDFEIILSVKDKTRDE